jgi:hypothetical protein
MVKLRFCQTLNCIFKNYIFKSHILKFLFLNCTFWNHKPNIQSLFLNELWIFENSRSKLIFRITKENTSRRVKWLISYDRANSWIKGYTISSRGENCCDQVEEFSFTPPYYRKGNGRQSENGRWKNPKRGSNS